MKTRPPEHRLGSVGISPPAWEVPFPYGQHQAIQSMGTVAAPLLAGFSLTLAGLVLSRQDAVMWPNLALLLLVCAALALLGSVQATFWARRFTVSPSDLVAWWPDHEHPERRQLLRREQFNHALAEKSWANRASAFYNAGLAFLILAIAVVLIPEEGLSSPLRIAAIAVALVGLIGELLWIGAYYTNRLEPRYVEPVDGRAQQ